MIDFADTFDEAIRNWHDRHTHLEGERELNDLGRPSWDDWFMGMCFWVSLRSPDPSTKHGAILCNDSHQILGVGYNGFPRGCKDANLPLTRPAKYDVIIHAEENCILNSQNILLDSGYTMYITGFPCSRCFAKLMQCGVQKVVYGPLSSRCIQGPQEKLVRSLAMDGGIELTEYAGQFECLSNIDVFKNLLRMST